MAKNKKEKAPPKEKKNAAPKAGIKDLLMKKGEKIGLGVALGAFVLFLVLGVSSSLSAGDPKVRKQELDKQAAQLDSMIKNEQAKAAPLPDMVKAGTGGHDYNPVDPDKFVAANGWSEPSQRPSQLRDNPRVLAPIDSQVNYYAGSYKGFDRLFRFNEAGEVIEVKYGVLEGKTQSDFDYKGMEGRLKEKPKPAPRRPGAPVLPPMAPGVPPAPAVAQPPGEMRPGGGKPTPGAGNGEREELAVKYYLMEEAQKLKLPPARTIFPTRLVVVQMDLPIKDQLVEIMKALRLPTLLAARQEASLAAIEARMPPRPAGAAGTAPPAPAPAPAGAPATDLADSPGYLGLVVQRRITPIGGQASDWEPYEHQERFFEKFTRYDSPTVVEDGLRLYFQRPYQGLTSPLPIMSGGFLKDYPPNPAMKGLFDNYQKLLNMRVKMPTAAELYKQFDRPGTNNPYLPSTPTTGSSGFGTEDQRPGGAFVAPPPGGKTNPESIPVAGNPAMADANKMDVEHLLLRFLDTDLEPGNTYEYRVMVRMKNPNFKNPAKVANASMADEEILESSWYEVPQKVSVPRENFVYAYSTKKYEEHVKKLMDQTAMTKESPKAKVVGQAMDLEEVTEGRKVVVQFQRWQSWLSLAGGTKQEPIGSWIVAETPVGPGEYIGRRTLVELPLWRSNVIDPKAPMGTDAYTGGYQLPSNGDGKTPLVLPWPKDSGNVKYLQPRARIMDFRTPNVLVDFDGGRVHTKAGGKTEIDEVAADLLILRDDGKIEVRREALDVGGARATHEVAFNEWVERIRKFGEPETTPGTGTSPLPRGSGTTPMPR